ncbi:hypothetical protein Emtol_2818 [Emticicia oligotrophica DSM 17448]|uniref:Transposase n=1 Tax=Emticicia oligotrophica (strain DSM 17448 / CIP 109782 / MTCC 6937 / GPTSA100-15) TaxID=929562 RepID=A0ABN4AND8_EMTOG|nr:MULTISPECIES: hypothetical protein [Emticicia]AFK03953.1 hypothetical protein Emtol_2818 [Emticicia oligotrophica DSM 17448]
MYIADSINFEYSENQKGARKDFDIFEENLWLHDTEIRYIIDLKNGRWHLTMLFISIYNPLKLRCHYLDHYDSQKKAELYAQIFQRGIRKDARGTLKLNENAYNICYN